MEVRSQRAGRFIPGERTPASAEQLLSESGIGLRIVDRIA